MTQMMFFLAIPAYNIRPIDMSSLSSSSSTLSKQGGRPKGTTIKSTHDLQARTIEASNFAAEEFERAQLKRRWDGKKWVSKGVYDEIINEASARFHLPDTIVLSKETAQTQIKEGQQILVMHVGSTSPVLQGKVHLLNLILKLAAMNQLITPTEGLALANSLINGTSLKEKLKEWKKKIILHSNT